MYRKGWMSIAVLFLTGCAVSPQPASIDQRYQEAKENLRQIFAPQQRVKYKKIDFYQALARGVTYNLDYRIKLANNALQMGQLDLAEFTMFPNLNATGSEYSRSNDLSSSSVTTSTGQVSGISNSTPRTVRSLRGAISWNILDFGLSYVRARQQADRYLIAEEEARKQLQQLSQDILTSYWEAYSAQQLMQQTIAFSQTLEQARHKMEMAVQDLTIPRDNLLTYEEAILDGQRRLIQLRYKYEKAMYDLKHLLSIAPEEKLVLAPLPPAMVRATDLSKLDFSKLDAITLVKRPELWGQSYQQQIAKLGIRSAILQALPGITLNAGWNYNSNKYLQNKNWIDGSADLAWNLLNIASLPTAIHSAKDQVKYEKMKLMALTLGILTETRYAYSHYESLRKEYFVAKKQTATANALYKLAQHRQEASLVSSRQVILAQIHALATKMDEDLLLSDLSKARGELYLSAGFDMLPMGVSDKPLPVVVNIIRRNFMQQNKMDFGHYVDFIHQKIFPSRYAAASSRTMAALPVPWHACTTCLPLPRTSWSKRA